MKYSTAFKGVVLALLAWVCLVYCAPSPPSLQITYTASVSINDTVVEGRHKITEQAAEVAHFSVEFNAALQRYQGQLIEGDLLYLLNTQQCYLIQYGQCQPNKCPDELNDVNLPPFQYASQMSFVKNVSIHPELVEWLPFEEVWHSIVITHLNIGIVNHHLQQQRGQDLLTLRIRRK